MDDTVLWTILGVVWALGGIILALIALEAFHRRGEPRAGRNSSGDAHPMTFDGDGADGGGDGGGGDGGGGGGGD